MSNEQTPALPTYATIADALEKKNGAGLRLVGWTAARTLLIMPGMLVVGVDWKKALFGSLISSSLISVLTFVRIYNAGFEAEAKAYTQYRRNQKMKRWTSRG